MGWCMINDHVLQDQPSLRQMTSPQVCLPSLTVLRTDRFDGTRGPSKKRARAVPAHPAPVTLQGAAARLKREGLCWHLFFFRRCVQPSFAIGLDQETITPT